jgi:HEAT repeat protein
MERLEDEDADVQAAAVQALASLFGKLPDVTGSIVERLMDPAFVVRFAAVEVIAGSAPETVAPALLEQLRPWLMVDTEAYKFESTRAAQSRLAALLGPRIPGDSSLRDWLLAKLCDPRWSARLGAALTLLHWPEGPPGDVLDRVFEALGDQRGLEAYPAQLTAASFLINQNNYVRGAIDLCLEALDYGMQTWEGRSDSWRIRQQAALVLGKLEPVGYDERVYDRLLQVMENDQYLPVIDAAYGALVRLARIRDGMADAAM